MRLPSIILALLIAAGLTYWFVLRGAADRPMAALAGTAAEAPAESTDAVDAPVPVMVLPSEAQQVADFLVLRGRTTAARLVNVPAETAGLVVSQPFRKGATVEEGQLLCKIDPGARLAQLAEAEAGLAEARTESEAANQLSQKGYAAETTRVAREAQLQAAEAAVDLVKLDIERLEIHAPFSGVLESDTAELGSRLGLGDICATIIDLSSVRVLGFVSEREVDSIAVGTPASARLINGREVEGEITFISRMSDAETRTYEVEVTLPNADGQIRDGMTAELRIPLPAETAHLIPQTALTLNDEGELGVRLVEGDSTRFQPVTLLRDERRGVWVSGLPEKTEIVVVGQEFVRDGRRIVPHLIGWDDLS